MADGKVMDLGEGRHLFVSVSEGGGMPVLFLNSLAADLGMWDGVRGRMSRRSVAFDAHGHGRSGVTPGDCTVDDLAEDALAVMDATGLDRAVLCGLSLGGATAMAMAAKAPDRVAGLVLANTAISFPPPGMWQDRAATARSGGFASLVEPTLERWLTEGYRAANPGTTDQVRAMIAGTSAEGYAACCAALAVADLGPALGGYGGPVLLVAGAHDASTPVARAEEMQALCDRADLVVLDAAHISSIEAEADFADRLEAFVTSLEKGQGHG
ncbi:alpha/beta fold hydrolase [Roseibacterium sp. SDUM158016]|uniref:alpha/beta fold hydrolase n=1 Tax=Roseicyclus sediminis TaxID=2980997 RepID=UPI0021D027D1|nr:alpha/beta fold hydrolase [Roseibacterium sp. SDUM158016]MCU4652028.1 alpha/beta fold hydrolase [Roseibacterium sp. SDUM158016]